MPFLKQDLTSDFYNWQPETSIYTGNPSRRVFDRFNGDQVLFIINYYGSLSGKFSIQEGRRMEELIRNQLPLDLKSEVSVFNWLRGVL
ncbi:MAG TPA: hypothetical protein VFX58_08080 [Chitinophagaceae bacterium]|nr:hypothetical protein [Chitinophagaceae bacterium]